MIIGSFRAYFNTNIRVAIQVVNLIKANVNDASKDFRAALTLAFPTTAPQLLTALTNALANFTLTDSADSADPISNLVSAIGNLPELLQDTIYNKLAGLIANELAGPEAPASQYQTDTLIQLCYGFDKFNSPAVVPVPPQSNIPSSAAPAGNTETNPGTNETANAGNSGNTETNPGENTGTEQNSQQGNIPDPLGADQTAKPQQSN